MIKHTRRMGSAAGHSARCQQFFGGVQIPAQNRLKALLRLVVAPSTQSANGASSVVGG